MKHVHFLGIAGSGASAIAAIAQAQGYKVTGCDRRMTDEFTKEFRSDQLTEGHSKSHLEGVDILAVTPAIFSFDPNNEELITAKEKGIPVMSWQQFMGKYLEEEKFVIAVCGTHGKSTTTAMIGLMLEDAGLDPTVELGAIVPKWGSNYRIGEGKFFVTEADEFNNNFMASIPNISVVTTIEMDHPEFFKDLDAYKDSFEDFLAKTHNTIVANLTDSNVADVIKYVMKRSPVTVTDYSKNNFNLNLQIPGAHNNLNATAVFQVGLILGIDTAVLKKSLESFEGIGRRFEIIGQLNGAKVISDFGHHPTEIKVTLEAARDKYPDSKIYTIFQPHLFSRTKALFNEFVEVLQELPVDKIAVTDIYQSREQDIGLVNSKELVTTAHSSNIEYIPEIEQSMDKFGSKVQNGDVIFLIGAGDIDIKARNYLKKINE